MDKLFMKNRIGNLFLISSMLFIMITEWNFYEWYKRFSNVNIYVMAIGILFATICYWKYSTQNLFFLIGVVLLVVFSFFSSKVLPFYCVALVFSFLAGFYLINVISFSNIEQFISLFVIGFFFIYWTIDVKGYFKGYDTNYGAMILLCGFIACMMLLEYFRYSVKYLYSDKNIVIRWLKKYSFTIVYIEILICLVGIKIMAWYQSVHAIEGLLLFLLIIMAPHKLLSNKYFIVFFTLIVCGYTAIFGVWTYLVLKFGMTWWAAAIVSIGILLAQIVFLILLSSKCCKTYFAKVSYAAIITIIAVSSKDVCIVLQPFILIIISLSAIANSIKFNNEKKDFHTQVNMTLHKTYLKEALKKHFKIACLLMTALFVQICIRIPLEVYYGNQKDLLCSVGDFMPIVVSIGLIITIIGTIVISCLDSKTFNNIISILFILVLLTYIQDMFMNIKLVEPNGVSLQFELLKPYSYFNALVWIIAAVILVVILKRIRNNEKIIVVASTILILIQAVAAISIPITTKTIYHKETYGLSDENEFEFAKDINTVVFILDMVGNVQMDMAMETYPDLLNDYDDFIYYTNADSVYKPTYPSITHMLTGENIDFSYDNAYEWLHNAWTNDRVNNYYNNLRSNNIDYYCYTKDIEYEMGDGNNIVDKFKNIVTYTHCADRKKLSYQFLKMSIFRVMPYLIKPYYVMTANDLNTPVELVGDTEPFEYYNWLFADKMNKSTFKINDTMEKAVKVYHLSGSHAPRLMDMETNKVEYDVDTSETIYGCMEIIRRYMNNMKKLGIYDNATIIITADHGTDKEAIDPQPIFLIKSREENRHSMLYSNAPISHDDLPATIYYSMGLDYSDYGKCVFDYKDNEKRDRTLWFLNDDMDKYYVYNYSDNRDKLLEKFPDYPDEIINNTLYWTK